MGVLQPWLRRAGSGVHPYNAAMFFPLAMLVLMLVVVGVGLCAVAAGLMAWSLTHPPRMGDGKAMWVHKLLPPGDLGLEFEDVKFVVRDERGKRLSIAGWWIPNP